MIEEITPEQPKEGDMSHHRARHSGFRRTIHHYVCGSVAIAAIRNLGSSRHAVGKARPVVLVAADQSAHGGWLVASLTSNGRYLTTGVARPRLVATAINGLDLDGYLWGSSLIPITADCLHVPIGMVDVAMAETIIANCRLTVPQIDGLRRAAVGHNWGEAA